MNYAKPFFFTLISGFMLLSAWTFNTPGWISLFSLIPFLFAEDSLSKTKHPNLLVFLAALLLFFTVGFSSTRWISRLLSYWVYIYYLLNAAVYALVALFASYIKRKTTPLVGYSAFVAFFVAFEFLYYKVDFLFPFIVAGLSPVTDTASLVQWYEYTGVLGGSVWILTSNILFFLFINKFIATKSLKQTYQLGLTAICVGFLPMLLSLAILHHYKETDNPVETILVQPNLDPYTEKFHTDRTLQANDMLRQAEQAVTTKTKFIVMPETALSGNIWENNISENPIIIDYHNFILRHDSNLCIIAGADMMKYLISHDGTPPTPTSVKAGNNIYVEMYNVALLISGSEVRNYKKMRRVLFTEYKPFADIINYTSAQMTGFQFSLGTQDRPTIQTSPVASVASVICFESLFGNHVRQLVDKGAEAVFVITNDGWWNNTIGPKQHFRFSQIRAIENRRDVARCGNTGISAFINQRGEVVSQAPWWQKTTLKGYINLNYKKTFYTKHGDYIGLIASILSIIIIITSVIIIVRRKENI